MAPDRYAILLPWWVIAVVALLPVVLFVVLGVFGPDVYIDLMSALSIVVALAFLGAVLFTIGLVIEENNEARSKKVHLGWRRMTFTRVLAISVLAGQTLAIFIAITQVIRLLQFQAFEWMPPLIATAFVGFESLLLICMAYLALLRRVS